MQKIIDKIEIHHQEPREPYFIIYYTEYYDDLTSMKKKESYVGDEIELQKYFDKSMEELRKIYDIETISHQRSTSYNLRDDAKIEGKKLNYPKKEKNDIYTNFEHEHDVQSLVGPFWRNSEYNEKNINNRRVPGIDKIRIKKLVLTASIFTILTSSLVGGIVLHKKNVYNKVISFHNSKSIEYYNAGNKIDSEDMAIFKNYERFEEVMSKLSDGDYSDIEYDDIKFFQIYLESIFKSNTNNNSNTNNDRTYHSGYNVHFMEYLKKHSGNQFEKISEIEEAYNKIVYLSPNKNVDYNVEMAKNYCKKAIDYIVGDFSYQTLPDYEKVILLTQLKSIVTDINYKYPTGKGNVFIVSGYQIDKFTTFLDNEINQAMKGLSQKVSTFRHTHM